MRRGQITGGALMMSEKQSWSTLIKRLISWLKPNASTMDANQTRPHVPLVLSDPFPVPFDATHTAQAIRVSPHVPPAAALAALDLPPYNGVLVFHGGAGKMEKDYMDAARQFLIRTISPLAQKHHLLIIDGGTQSGTAQILGEAREALNGTYPLIGVMPEGSVSYPTPDSPAADDDDNKLNRSHSHFILVEGSTFGDESELLVGLLRAAGCPGAAFVINGGDIVLTEAKMHGEQGNPIITLRGSGRLADRLADPTSTERRQLPPSTRLHVVNITDPQGCIDLLNRLLKLSG